MDIFRLRSRAFGAGAALLLLLLPGTAKADSLGERFAAPQTADTERALLKFLDDAGAAGATAAPVVVMRGPIDPRDWDKWKKNGVAYAVNLKPDAWILRVAVSRDAAANARMIDYLKRAVAAEKLFAYLAPYKTDLIDGKFRYTALRKDTDPNVVVEFFSDTPAAVVKRAVAGFHRGPRAAERKTPLLWALRIDPARIGTLAANDYVSTITESLQPLPLMNEMRAAMHVDEVQNMTWAGSGFAPVYNLSGHGVRMSNNEGLAPQHPDFKLDPADVSPRWLGCGPGMPHGSMTAGIMLGDGSGSLAGGAPYDYYWRGVAPEATFVCDSPDPVTGLPDVANLSMAWNFGIYGWDARYYDSLVRAHGASTSIVRVRAFGNNGPNPPQYDTERGYYSPLGTSKNEIVVGNVAAYTLCAQCTGTSIGPPFNQRLLPNVVATGTVESYTGPLSGMDFDIGSVKVAHQFSTAENWVFVSSFQGWGQDLGTAYNGYNDVYWSRGTFGYTLETAPCGPGSSACMHIHMPLQSWPGTFWLTPFIATFAASGSNFNGAENLHIVPTAYDVVSIRYRIRQVPERDIAMGLIFGLRPQTGDPQWPPGHPNQFSSLMVSQRRFPVVTDGAWHTATIVMGADTNWVNKPFINYFGITYLGPDFMHIPVPGNAVDYGAAGGTSAAAPVVAGVAALMLERATKPPLNVTLSDHVSHSPYFKVPGTGNFFPSTVKAMLIHTATDLAYVPHSFDYPVYDTNAPPQYYKGPDLFTGYGLVNAKAAIDLMDRDAAAPANAKIVREDQFTNADVLPPGAVTPCPNTCYFGYRQYTLTVPPNRMLPLKVTLAWDDPEGSDNPDPAVQIANSLVDDLDLVLIGPDGHQYHSWSLEPPYMPQSLPAGYQGNVEPEPMVAADVTPARRDRFNDRDNVEQVLVDLPQPGVWHVLVEAHMVGAPYPQDFSLVIDGAAQPPATHLNGGKVVWASTVGSIQQLFVKTVGSSTETQITNGPTSVYDPAWSFNGQYICHIRAGGWEFVWHHIGPFWLPWWVWRPESIDIRDPAGTLIASYPTPVLTGRSTAKYPDWSPDGQHIVVTTFDGWGALELRLIDFSAPYNFTAPTTRILVPTNFGGNGEDPGGGSFSHDGKYVFFSAGSDAFQSRLFKATLSNGAVQAVYGDGVPTNRAFSPSVSPDDTTLVYNSELYKDAVPDQIDEELLSVGLQTGTIAQLSHAPGDQYGRFAKNGAGMEMLYLSYTAPQSAHHIYLYENGTLSAALTSAHREDGGADWVK